MRLVKFLSFIIGYFSVGLYLNYTMEDFMFNMILVLFSFKIWEKSKEDSFLK